jgi:hypothetical protein
LESLFKRRLIQPGLAPGEAFRRPFMLAQTCYTPTLPGQPEEVQPLLVLGQVINVEGGVYLWADGLDMFDPVLIPIGPCDDGATRYIDTVSNYFEVHQRLVLQVLDVATREDLDLSPMLVARAVEIMRDNLEESPEHALDVALTWSQVILDLDRMGRLEKMQS